MEAITTTATYIAISLRWSMELAVACSAGDEAD